MSEIYILGTGVLAEEVFALVHHSYEGSVAGFVENWRREKVGKKLCGRPIIWVDDLPNGAKCVCSLATTKRKGFIDQVRDKAQFITYVHTSSMVLPSMPRIELGEGVLISAGVIIGSNTQLGNFVFINRGVKIGHHTKIGDYTTIQPGVNIAGCVEIGTAAYIGMGSIIIDRLKIGSGSTIAAGSVVIKDVPENVLVAGNPAVVKKENIDER